MSETPADTGVPIELKLWGSADVPDPLGVIEADLSRLTRELAEARLATVEADKKGRDALRQVFLPLLDVCDAFERVFAHIQSKQTEGVKLDAHVRAWVSNFKTTHKLLCRTLGENGIQKLETAPQFDPHHHKILEVRNQSGIPDGTIVETSLPGYAWKGELLRKAEVIVVRGDALTP